MSHQDSSRSFRADAQTRTRIAQLAATLILEHGIRNWQDAKRKAARQLLLPDNLLPDDDELEVALMQQQMLFGAQRKLPQSVTLSAKRRQALRWMDCLAAFTPKLYGGIAEGWGGEHQAVHLELTSDDPKAVELTLINGNSDYQLLPDPQQLTLVVHDEEGDVILKILPTNLHRKRKYKLYNRDTVAGWVKGEG